MLDSNTLGKTISFDTYAQHVIGIDFQRVALVGLLDTDSARHYVDVSGMAQAIYPTLPKGTPIDYREYTWAKLKLGNGKFTCVALPWIKETTIKIHTDVSLSLSISGIGASDVNIILDILRSHGYTKLSSKIL